jgi:hypothetical protein
MNQRQLLPIATLALLQLCTVFSLAQASQAEADRPAVRPRRAQASGILTDRLSKKDLEKWKAIERMVFAENEKRQPRYPTLRGLYEWAETSGHAIYIELPSPQRAATCTAGSFTIEQLDATGERHVGVIKLFLANIDAAYVGPKVARENGFIPFDGLRKEARYAEVLGHELAHAAYILTNPERAQIVQELVEETNEMLLTHSRELKSQEIGPEMRQRLSRRDELLKELEEQAESMEEVIWRELYSAAAGR